MENNIKVYNPSTDEMELVTQEWCDKAQASLNKLARQRSVIREISRLNIIEDEEKLEKIGEFLRTLGIKW